MPVSVRQEGVLGGTLRSNRPPPPALQRPIYIVHDLFLSEKKFCRFSCYSYFCIINNILYFFVLKSILALYEQWIMHNTYIFDPYPLQVTMRLATSMPVG